MHVGTDAERVADREHRDIGSSISQVQGGNLLAQKWQGNHLLGNDLLLALIHPTQPPLLERHTDLSVRSRQEHLFHSHCSGFSSAFQDGGHGPGETLRLIFPFPPYGTRGYRQLLGYSPIITLDLDTIGVITYILMIQECQS